MIIILRDVLPFSEQSELKCSAIVQGFCGFMTLPLHSINLNSVLVSGKVSVAVCPSIPINGVSLILGNDLAGDRVLAAPVVTSTPTELECPDKLEQEYPDVFPVCAVTRAMSKKPLEKEMDPHVDLSDTFLAKCDTFGFGDSFPSHEDLKAAQASDKSLSSLFDNVVPEGEAEKLSRAYFISNGVLMRKWTPPELTCEDSWGSFFQVVVPVIFRTEVLRLAHDHGLAGHMGVRKTLDRVTRHFYWPGVKSDVTGYCKTCHVCQVVGKPNQTIPRAPLHPIPAIGEPFEHVLVDCVGPLPRTKSGNQYLLTMMCTATRFPEAVPLRTITATAVSKALVKFFTLFGLPRVIQTDQGTNFMSRVFSQVLQQFSIKHCTSSAYHPESQGALERFHQTLKTMLRVYCQEFGKEWDDGVPLLLFAAREVTQESLGFSPAELVVGHTVRGPLKLLKERWLEEPTCKTDLMQYVCGFRSKLLRACELARKNLEKAQEKMKLRYDKHTQYRVFSPGDKVLVLLPLPGSTLQSQYSGPFTVVCKISDTDYLVRTPDRKRKERRCHVNLLKPYFDREIESRPIMSLSVSVSDPVDTSNVALRGIPERRLLNSELLSSLDVHLAYLDCEKRADIVAILHRYLELFSDVPTCTSVLEHDIDVGDALPVKQHPYRINPEKRRIMQQEVSYMLQHGIAQPSSSPWSSPCLLVEKSDKSPRFCTDFRKVNSFTKPDCFPLPRLDDCIDRVGSAAYVTKLDLLKGYWQVPLTPRACEISAFATPDDFCQYTVMAFGMRNAPATFQRLINTVLRDVSGCEAYLDDVVVCSSCWPDHLSQLSDVFLRLTKANLTLNLAKCVFGQATVTYLGKVVGCGQVCPVEAKIEAIVNFCVPSTRRDLRRFLGMAGYYRGFCKNFSIVAAPLTTLLSPKVSFEWSEACQVAFSNLKSLMACAPVLVSPDFNLPFKLAVDASEVGAGAVLLQDRSGVEHPVCYFSRKFNCHQLRYSTIEKEALALILALEHFEVYVSSTQTVVVYTDHNPLVALQRMKNSNQRLMRWCLFLQGFVLDIRHI
uniref:Gypsy retrotransposon integrase-like protein 1 n=1 Tax=Oryzias latipes TaxID=8090 RepID=A0A3B3H3T2_ORYLA